ncbi:MAG TPA: MFS transporter [Candidatus Binatia bacterium]
MKVSRQASSLLVLFGSASLWNICIGMNHVVIPLYAHFLGFSILKVSSVVSLPVLATFFVRFVGGALSDRFGERKVLQACYLLNTLSALVLLQAAGFVSLFVAVAISNVSRSFFWTPAQSMASQLPGLSSGKSLGRLSACNAAGNFVGVALGGALVAISGYAGTFIFLLGATLTSSVLGFFLPAVEEKPRGRSVWKILVGIGDHLRRGRTWFTITASFAAGLTPALCQSIYPVYLAELHYGAQWIGATLSVRGLGPVISGLLLAAWITPSRQLAMYAAGMAGLGIFLIGSGLVENLFLLALCIVALGTGSGLMDVWYQVEATNLSTAHDRSVAMASMGMGWNFSYIVMPLVAGWIADAQGVQFSLWAMGGFFLVVAAGTRVWHRLLAPATS